MKRTALVLRNPRTTGGSTTHLNGWRASLDELGFDTIEIAPHVTPHKPWRHLASTLDVMRGRAVPESAVWCSRDVKRAIEAHDPDVVIAHTARSALTVLASVDAHTVVDYVDQLSSSYEQRAGASRGWRAAAYRWLARRHRLVELAPPGDPVRVVVGATDAEAMRATWLPVLPTLEPSTPTTRWEDRPYDMVFFGSLNYPPNVEALEWLAAARDHDLSVLVAGRKATDSTRDLIETAGWDFIDGYDSVAQLADLARVAVAPLVSAAGIQNKVFEAALVGLPQVTSPAALAGFGHPIPTRIGITIDDIIDEVESLLADPNAAKALTVAARWSIEQHYSVGSWLPTVAQIVGAEYRVEDRVDGDLTTVDQSYRPSAPSTSRKVRTTMRASNTKP